MPPRLSEAEIEKLRVLYEDSPLSVLALIRETGHSHRTIYYYAARRGWKPRVDRRKPRLPRTEIRSLYEGTIIPVVEIARLAGVAVQTVHVHAAKEGWKPRNRKRHRVTGEVEDVDKAVADARARAEAERARRAQRAELAMLDEVTRLVRQVVRSQVRAAKRAAPAKPKRSEWLSPEEKARGHAARRKVDRTADAQQGAADEEAINRAIALLEWHDKHAPPARMRVSDPRYSVRPRESGDPAAKSDTGFPRAAPTSPPRT